MAIFLFNCNPPSQLLLQTEKIPFWNQKIPIIGTAVVFLMLSCVNSILLFLVGWLWVILRF